MDEFEAVESSDDQRPASSERDLGSAVPMVVAIGASAGGLEALSEFFEGVGDKPNLAFVVIQHLAPHQKSHMAELLGRRTSLRVEFATDGMEIRRNIVVVMPSDKHLEIRGGRLYLLPREVTGDFRDNLPIDQFFHSLANEIGHRAVGVVLSGTGSDGTRGIRSIKEAGGLVVVQDTESAKFDGMPRSAASTGLVDLVLRPGEMPEQISNYALRAFTVSDSSLLGDESELESVLGYLGEQSGTDLNHYKQSTVVRRIQRRIAVTQCENLERYHALLRRSPQEAESLRDDLLIHVTSFYRDLPVWQALKAQIPRLISECDPREGIRVWVTACSTGEEAYTVAMCLEEAFTTLGTRVPYKIFASDVDQGAVERASAGSYPSSISTDLDAGLLARFFEKSGSRYIVTRQIRERIIFAQHNLITDPPFTKMDIVTCRNLLIYLKPEVQDRVIRILQFSLRQDGFLLLGSSETLAEQLDGFDVVDSKWKLFRSRRRSLAVVGDSLIDLGIEASGVTVPTGRISRRIDPQQRFVNSLQQDLIESALPPTAVADSNRAMVQSFGDVGEFLRIPPGSPTLDVAKMARGELAMLLATAVRRVAAESEMLVFDNVSYGPEVGQRVRVTVRRIGSAGGNRPLVAIQFEQRPIDREDDLAVEDLDAATRKRVGELERDLQYTRESLQATVEELETTNEELQASNEELISSNEELQSTNEELQSVNEELHTMNGEFQVKIEDLTVANDDFMNLMYTTSVGAVFLDSELRVRRFTEALGNIIGLVPADVGRRISDFHWRVRGRDISAEASAVLEQGVERSFLVYDTQESWYWMCVRPYSAIDSHLEGVVVTCVDITDEHLRERQFSDLEALTVGVAMPIVVAGREGEIHHANRAFGDLTGRDAATLSGTPLSAFLGAEVLQALKECLSTGESWHGPGVGSGLDGDAFWAEVQIAPVEDGAELDLAVVSFTTIRNSPPEADDSGS